MKFKILPRNLRKQQNSILNKNERLATNIVNATPSSTFNRSRRHLTTFDSSKLVPIFVDECLPGDIYNIDTSTLIRLSTPNAATMENPIMDIHFFFVPNRIIWDKWKYFMGENKNAGYQKEYKTVPSIVYDSTLKYSADDLAAYLGFPVNVNMSTTNLSINSLYFKAYGQIWNDYYRDQNLQGEIDITNNNKNDENVKVSEYENQGYQSSIQIGKGLAPVSRLADYFSTCLPWPQKGDTVTIDTLPLQNLQLNLKDSNIPVSVQYNDNAVNSGSLKLFSGNTPVSNTYLVTNNTGVITDYSDLPTGISGESLTTKLGINNSELSKVKIELKDGIYYSINDLRLSLAFQHIRELDARGGTRYTEYLLNHFGVQAADSRLDRAEMIGGWRDNININNIVQSSAGDSSSPLGVLGGVSVTSSTSPRQINYAVKEHGIIMGFVIVRPQVNYSQGLNKIFTRIEKLDYFEPLLANIGEQPVYKYELYVSDTDNNDNLEIFGYNEAWADYRYANNTFQYKHIN